MGIGLKVDHEMLLQLLNPESKEVFVVLDRELRGRAETRGGSQPDHTAPLWTVMCTLPTTSNRLKHPEIFLLIRVLIAFFFFNNLPFFSMSRKYFFKSNFSCGNNSYLKRAW